MSDNVPHIINTILLGNLVKEHVRSTDCNDIKTAVYRTERHNTEVLVIINPKKKAHCKQIEFGHILSRLNSVCKPLASVKLTNGTEENYATVMSYPEDYVSLLTLPAIQSLTASMIQLIIQNILNIIIALEKMNISPIFLEPRDWLVHPRSLDIMLLNFNSLEMGEENDVYDVNNAGYIWRGEAYFRPPELLKEGKFTRKIAAAYGVGLLTLTLFGHKPLRQIDRKNANYYRKKIPLEAKGFIDWAITPTKELRATTRELRDHHWPGYQVF